MLRPAHKITLRTLLPPRATIQTPLSVAHHRAAEKGFVREARKNALSRPGSQVCSASSTQGIQPMEIEVKLRLADAEAHSLAGKLFSSGHVVTHQQENFFFDGGDKELSSRLSVLRVRFYDTDKKAVLTLKGKAIVKDGIGKASEVEEDVDPKVARTFVEQPDELLAYESNIMKDIQSKWSVASLKGLGGFRNVRQVFKWEGFTLELDETKYDFGTLYELECETDQPEMLRDKLEAHLNANGVSFKYSTSTKFAHFINRTLED
ncbi:hypothetical protein BSKO_01428 [Bryopsis sp. KO-2023]|nr:hypothetical protein BSKO_01428 [Bryopsis sp. KO-2023]